MSQGALERALGRSKGTATHWLAGAKVPDLETAVRMRRLLGIPEEAWVSQDNPMSSDELELASGAA